MALSRTVDPTLEPVTLAEAKTHLRVEHEDEDSYIEDTLIPAASQEAEVFTCRALLNQTYVLKWSSFGHGPIVLPKPPLSSVTSVQYVDTDGSTQTWSTNDYTVETPSGPFALHGSIRPNFNTSYPSARVVVDSITITFVAGYGAAATAVPRQLHVGVLMFIEDAYRGRGSTETGRASAALRTARLTLAPFRACRDDLRLD